MSRDPLAKFFKDFDEGSDVPGTEEIPDERKFEIAEGPWTEIIDASDTYPYDLDADALLPRDVDEMSRVDGDVERVRGSRPSALAGDDFQEHLEQYDDGAVVGEDDFDREVRKKSSEVAAAKSRALYVRTSPESSSRALLGGQATIVQGKSPQQVVNWEGRDIEACAVSVSLMPLSTLTTTLGFGLRPFGRIRYGTRDGSTEVDVDLGFGTQFTVLASSLYISVGLDTPAETDPSGSFRLAASIGFGTVTRSFPITRTLYWNNNSSASVTFARPKLATTIYDIQRVDPTSQITVEFYDGNNVQVGERVLASNQYLLYPISISNDVASMTFSRTSGVNDQQVRIICGLAL